MSLMTAAQANATNESQWMTMRHQSNIIALLGGDCGVKSSSERVELQRWGGGGAGRGDIRSDEARSLGFQLLLEAVLSVLRPVTVGLPGAFCVEGLELSWENMGIDDDTSPG